MRMAYLAAGHWRSTARRLRREETGMVAIMAAACMVVLVGFIALAFDVGMLFVEQTKLQKAVDASALAGAQAIDLKNPGSTAASLAAAQTYLTYNGVDACLVGTGTGCEVAANQPTVVTSGACAAHGCLGWLVTAQRQVKLSFAPVLGIPQATVRATATAISSPISAAQNPFDYAIWAGNPAAWPLDPFAPLTPSPQDYYCVDTAYSNLNGLGCSVNGGFSAGSAGPASSGGYVFNDNNYQSDIIYGDPNKCWDPSSGLNVKQEPQCNPNWPAGFTGNNFKGFLGPKGSGPFMSGYFQVGSTVQDQGGNQNQPDLCPYTNYNGQNPTPVVAPLVGNVTWDSGKNAYMFTIAAFRVVYINPANICPNAKQGKPWTVSIAASQKISEGLPGGSDVNGPIVVKLW